jgi:hypothetical protein
LKSGRVRETSGVFVKDFDVVAVVMSAVDIELLHVATTSSAGHAFEKEWTCSAIFVDLCGMVDLRPRSSPVR